MLMNVYDSKTKNETFCGLLFANVYQEVGHVHELTFTSGTKVL